MGIGLPISPVCRKVVETYPFMVKLGLVKILPMELLYIEATEKTPKVNFDPNKGEFEITGKAIPQDAEAFFGPILQWMEEYVTQAAAKTNVNLNLEYFNISASKRILFVLYKLNELVDKGKQVHVTWHYVESDDDMKEVGQDFAFMVRVPFEFVSHKRSEQLLASV